MRIRCRGALLAVLVGTGCLAACSPGHSTRATIDVDAPVALADQAVHLRVSGLHPHERVTVSSRAADYQDALWHGEATLAADGHGVVDLDRSAPSSGSYGGVDGMGLFWSMRPPTGDADHTSFYPLYPSLAASFEVTLTVTAAGRPIASRTVTRQWISAGVTHRALELGADRVAGELDLPPAGAPRRPGVLLIGGSEGGISGRYDAALLASHGYPALAVGYFGLPGLPDTLTDIPLEYFVSAARLLAAQPQAQPDAVVVSGYSRGSEAALLLADAQPALIRERCSTLPTTPSGPACPTAMPGPAAAYRYRRATSQSRTSAGRYWPSRAGTTGCGSRRRRRTGSISAWPRRRTRSAISCWCTRRPATPSAPSPTCPSACTPR